MEVVLPIEVQIPSLRIMKDSDLNEDEWIQTRLDQLNLIYEKRLAASRVTGVKPSRSREKGRREPRQPGNS